VIKAADPKEVAVHIDGRTVRIGIALTSKRFIIRRLARRIWVSPVATLRYPTPQLLDAIAKPAGPQ
jgi:hypothetical protein